MTEPKLKPCPICGSNNIQICMGRIDNGVPCDMDKPYYQAGCCVCGCVVDNYNNRTKKDVIKAWNKRVPMRNWGVCRDCALKDNCAEYKPNKLQCEDYERYKEVLTNEEWFCQLSTDEKATFFASNKMLNFDYQMWLEWLKEKHRKVT